MSLPFINDAYAATTDSAQAGGLSTILMLVVFFAIFYFLLIRPQAKRNKAHQQLVNDLQKGDEVVTSGGILGRIVKVEENILTLEVSENTQLKIQRNAVVSVLPKGSLKN